MAYTENLGLRHYVRLSQIWSQLIVAVCIHMITLRLASYFFFDAVCADSPVIIMLHKSIQTSETQSLICP